MGAAEVVAAGNFHILHMQYKHTWQDLEADGNSCRDHILGDIHNNPHSIDSAPVEAGTRNPAKNFNYFLEQNTKKAATNRYKQYLLVCRATTP
jgi:hypothetical protein